VMIGGIYGTGNEMIDSLSIIIPAYNSAKTLRLCLDSVIGQLRPQDQLIVVDDASSDKTSQVLSSYSSVLLLKHNQNLGPAAARNTGAQAASRSFLIFLDSDVLLKGDEFESVRRTLALRPDVAAITATLDDERKTHEFFTDYKNVYMTYIFSRCGSEVNFLYGSFCGVKRSEFIPWPTFPRLGEDSHLGYLLSMRGKKILLINSISVTHLKRYSLFSILMNDFRISENFTILFLSYKRWRTLFTNEKFGHTSKNQKSSLVLASLGTLLFFNLNPAMMIPVILWLVLNLDFFQTLYFKRGTIFLLKSIIWTYFDHLIYSAGILKGFFVYARHR
jgi:glycosyltransferase involved in cell wall biosynthesis